MTQKITDNQIFDALNYLIGNSLFSCGDSLNAEESKFQDSGYTHYRIHGLVTSTGLEEIRNVLPKSMKKSFFIDQHGLNFYH